MATITPLTQNNHARRSNQTLERLNPSSSNDYLYKSRKVRIINRTAEILNVSSLDYIVEVAMAQHEAISRPQVDMSEYTRGECVVANSRVADVMVAHLSRRTTKLMALLFGNDVPGSKARYDELIRGVHHCLLIQFKNRLSVVVDVTVAQLAEARPDLADVGALILVTNPWSECADLAKTLGGQWRYSLTQWK